MFFRGERQLVEFADKLAPMFAASVHVWSKVACAVAFVVAQIVLRVFKQKRCSQVGAFRAIQLANGFRALRGGDGGANGSFLGV